MSRDPLGIDLRKNLGQPMTYHCDCGHKIQAHSTTIALASLQHRRMHKRMGEKFGGENRNGWTT